MYQERPNLEDYNMKKKIVLFVSHSSNMYGAEQSLLSLVVNLNPNSNIIPIVLLPSQGRLKHELEKADIKTFVYPYSNWIGTTTILDRFVLKPIRFVKVLFSLFFIGQLIKSIKPDVIYSNTLASPVGAVIALLTKIPHIWHARENVKEGLNCEFDFGEKISIELIKKSSKIICNSFAVQKYLTSSIKENIFEVIYNGFAFDSIWNKKPILNAEAHFQSDHSFRVSIIGNIHPAKGHEDAIEALAQLVLRGFNIKLSVVGEGNLTYIQSLKKLAKSLSVEDNILWHGYINSPFQYFTDTAIVLICSRNESFGRTAIEALAAGIPVVGTASGGLTEIIVDGETGLLYEPGAHKKLAFQIERLLTNRQLYNKCILTGQQMIKKRFSMEQYVMNIESVIFDVCFSKALTTTHYAHKQWDN